MLRVGLTGGLASGKSTAARILASLGASVLQADELARELMQPGQPVFEAILAHFGPAALTPGHSLDRKHLARLAFEQGRLAELNQLVHPPVIAAQESWLRQLAAHNPTAVAVIESALIFEADQGGTAPGWRRRFHKLVLVTAPDDQKIARFLARTSSTPADARARLAAQMPDAGKVPLCDYILDNSTTLAALEQQTIALYHSLRALAATPTC